MINKLRNICSYLSEHRENLKIVLSSVLPTKIISLNHKVYDYNYMLYELSNSIANITFLNNYYLAGQDSKLLSRYERQSDVHDVHINDKGSAMFARAIRDRVFHAQRWQWVVLFLWPIHDHWWDHSYLHTAKLIKYQTQSYLSTKFVYILTYLSVYLAIYVYSCLCPSTQM